MVEKNSRSTLVKAPNFAPFFVPMGTINSAGLELSSPLNSTASALGAEVAGGGVAIGFAAMGVDADLPATTDVVEVVLGVTVVPDVIGAVVLLALFLPTVLCDLIPRYTLC